MKESEIQSQIIRYLDAKGYIYWRNYVGPIIRGRGKFMSKNPMAGLPDIIAFLKTHHRMVGIEVKTETGKLSEKQVMWLAKLKEAGCLCIVARSVKDVMDALETHEKY